MKYFILISDSTILPKPYIEEEAKDISVVESESTVEELDGVSDGLDTSDAPLYDEDALSEVLERPIKKSGNIPDNVDESVGLNFLFTLYMNNVILN